MHYQIFIEPKGDGFLGHDGTLRTGKEGWKEEFLEQIRERYGFDHVLRQENKQYRLIGLPFFNKNHNSNFERGFGELDNA